jgi:hypothetical protein
MAEREGNQGGCNSRLQGDDFGIMTSPLVPEMAATNAPTVQIRFSPSLDITEKLRAYYANRGPHDRDRSWEYCYKYFHDTDAEAIKVDRDNATFKLAFYLASFGMFRGSSFLLQYAYTVHLGVVDYLLDSKSSRLWTEEFGASDNDAALVPLILDTSENIQAIYHPFAEALKKTATKTLSTKVILGTMCCFPALDDYFKAGYEERFKSKVPEKLTTTFIQGILQFCRENVEEFRREQTRIESDFRMRCPLMKLVDAYFHEIGLELAAEADRIKKEAKKQEKAAKKKQRNERRAT